MLVYDYLAMELSSVVYIFHKGIISWVLCGYEVQMTFVSFQFLAKVDL